jgi:hypothetical protein
VASDGFFSKQMPQITEAIPLNPLISPTFDKHLFKIELCAVG